MSLAFVFPGQGSQYVGMGKDLYEQFPEARELFDRAESILDFPLKQIAFEGPEETLKQTRYTQPAIFVHSMAVLGWLNRRGIQPVAVAGHSLGEYSAVVAAGALPFGEALKLVALRGELMQQSGQNNPGTMAAIIGLPDDVVREICQTASQTALVVPANFNSPGQVVISGTVDGVHRAMELARERKARMVTELTVSGAFHSPLMKEALTGLENALNQAPFIDSKIPVYTNVTASPVHKAEEFRTMLKKQLLSPVLWEDIVRNMIQDGVNQFYEVGPSRVLCGLSRRIERKVPCLPLGKTEDFQALEDSV